MLPLDLKNLIMEYHDEFDVWKKRLHVKRIIKSAFAEWRRSVKIEHLLYEIFSDMHPAKIQWVRLTALLNIYDKRLIKIKNNKSCYSQIWTGCVPWN